jgi:hypothetical protein
VGWKHRRVHGQVRAKAVVLSPPSRDALRQKQSRRGPFGAAGLDLSRRGNLRSRARCGVPCVFFFGGGSAAQWRAALVLPYVFVTR